MEPIAFMFPGQGSQRSGMGLDFVERHPALVTPYHQAADEILGFPLSETCLHGSADSLRDTAITQPAVFLTSIVILNVLRAQGISPSVAAGHSLGEYAALTSADVLDWKDALRLVHLRGQLMAAVAEQVPGTMAAVLGLETDLVRTICARSAAATNAVVEVANDNGPGEVVISGEQAAVRHASEECRRTGARHIVPLKVSAPFHCRLMAGIEDEFSEALSSVEFRNPRIPVISSVTGSRVTTGREALAALRDQLTAPVLWAQTMRNAGLGAAKFVESGPGRVLSKLCNIILPSAEALPAGKAEELARAVDRLTAATV